MYGTKNTSLRVHHTPSPMRPLVKAMRGRGPIWILDRLDLRSEGVFFPCPLVFLLYSLVRSVRSEMWSPVREIGPSFFSFPCLISGISIAPWIAVPAHGSRIGNTSGIRMVVLVVVVSIWSDFVAAGSFMHGPFCVPLPSAVAFSRIASHKWRTAATEG